MKSIFTFTLVIIALSISAQTILEVHHGQQPYPTIQSAIDEALTGNYTGDFVEIRVYDFIEPYSENITIDLDTYNNLNYDELRIISVNGYENCTIAATDEEYPTITIKGDEETGIRTQVIISGFHITNATAYNNSGIRLEDAFYEEPIIPVIVESCKIEGNSHGISCNHSNIQVNVCVIKDNSDSGIIFYNDTGFVQVSKIQYSEMSNNMVGLNGVYNVSFHNYFLIEITNCSIVYNVISSNLDGYNHIKNCIVVPGGLDPYDAVVSYSCIQGGFIGTGNIDEDPLFTDPGNGVYTLQWNEQHISPCIDSGDPASPLDPDDTPADMGAFRAVDHDFHLTTAQHDRYRWRSFPVIDREHVQQGFETTYICAPVETQTDYFYIFDQEGHYQEWYENNWISNNILETLDSVEGYKLKTTSDVEIPTSGITLPEDTRVYLDEGENWVGYFVKESMGIYEAFAEIWDHITGLFGEDWAWAGVPHTRNTLIYGKMYIVRVDEACDFVYGEGSPVDPEEREMTEGFYYVETPEYSPINIESLDDPTVLEVGVFLDGECIGATQVEEFPLQILAFPAEGGRGSGDITFEFYCGGRSYKPAKEYKVLNKETGQYVNSKIELRPYEFTTICFGNPVTPAMFTLTGNYPNPFNPTTTISYSIPQDGNVELVIFNIKGQKVKTLVEGSQPAGSYNVTWNGKDENDRSVSSGLYFYKLNSSGKTAVKKMLLLK